MGLQKNFHRVGHLFIMLSLVGCSGSSETPPLGLVTGVVMMNGEPLAGAEVSFVPAKGRPSYSLTTADGKYDLIYVDKVHGALIGEHTVRITTFVEEDTPAAKNFKETIPKKYNVKSALKETVKSGRNEFRFELDSH